MTPLAPSAYLFAASTLLLALFTGAAWSQPSDADLCASLQGQPDRAIQHCTRAIDAGKLPPDRLARLHYNRAAEWTAKGDTRRAIADYDAALRLDPNFADAHFNRGHAWAAQGDPERAIADYGAAIRLNPGDPAAYRARAVEWMLTGDYARAVADYDAALGIEPKSAELHFGRGRARFYAGDHGGAAADMERSHEIDSNLYVALWLYLARKRSRALNAEELLDGDTRAERAAGWPGTLIVLFLGRTDLDSVSAAAVDPNPRLQDEQLCDVAFYTAQWRLLRGETEQARPLLEQARTGCGRDTLEYEGAVAELRRLQG